MDSGVIEVSDVLVITETFFYEPSLIIHLVDGSGIGIDIRFKDNGPETLIALAQMISIKGFALVMFEVIGFFFCRTFTIIECIQIIISKISLLE